MRLARELDSERFAIVLVGLSKQQIDELPEGIIGIMRTDSQQELAGIYTAADVFVHPGIEETYGMTVAEAQACGTRTIVREGSACVEAADLREPTLYSGSVAELAGIIERFK